MRFGIVVALLVMLALPGLVQSSRAVAADMLGAVPVRLDAAAARAVQPPASSLRRAMPAWSAQRWRMNRCRISPTNGLSCS